MIAYTLGPWKVVRTKDNNWRERYYDIWTDEGLENDKPIASCNGDNAVWLKEGEDFANANLIAAAPEMYEAIKEYLEWGAMTNSDRDYHASQLKKAIAKAEGKI